jgi:hypothetical protein
MPCLTKETFQELKNNNGSLNQNTNKLIPIPSGIEQDQEEIYIPQNPNNNTNHNPHEDPHDSDKESSDDTSRDQDLSSSEEEKIETAEEEDHVEDELIKSESEFEESSSDYSRRGSHDDNSSEKSDVNSHNNFETDEGSKDDQSSEEEEEDPFKEDPPQIFEPGPSAPQRSTRVPKPVIRSDNVYGAKTPAQIAKDIQSGKAWTESSQPKAKLVLKQAHNNLHSDLNTLLKEGGNKYVQYLLNQAIDFEKHPKEMHYRDVLHIKYTKPEVFKEWQKAMETEIQSLNDQKVWELVDLPQNQKLIKCRWVYDIKSNERR